MIWPGVHDERMMELRNRGLAAAPRVPWRSNGVFLSLVFFVLTSLGVGATYVFFHLVAAEVAWLTTVLCIALAEHLIRVRRFFGTGVESALWLGGLLVLIPELPGKGSNEVILVVAAAAALAGLRVRNALFGALACVLVIVYLVSENQTAAAAWTGVFLSILALPALAFEWERPSTDRLWTALLIIPSIGAAFAAMAFLSGWWVLVYAAVAILCVIAGLMMRMHAPLVAAAVYAVLAASTAIAHDLLPFPQEWSLIVGGCALLATSAIVARDLRERTRGIVVSPDALTAFDDEIQILGTIAVQPRVDAPGQPEGGGRFGGAGATGDY